MLLDTLAEKHAFKDINRCFLTLNSYVHINNLQPTHTQKFIVSRSTLKRHDIFAFC